MKRSTTTIGGIDIPVYTLHTIVAGSGAAGFNAADCLYERGVTDIAMLTNGVNFGTSRNTGSDKQTFYKLSLAGGDADSVFDMARTLFEGGATHGDTALADAAASAHNFYKLVDLGVPFPHNAYGEYCGYKTDHDPRTRATSAGPLTSKYMTERLEAAVRRKDIPILDGYLVIGVLLDNSGTRTVGLAALDLNDFGSNNSGLTLFHASNVIYALGGPGDMYASSVYPHSQRGGTGVAMLAGAHGANVQESQYGLASLGFRWNLSGSYQQVIPRYFSTAPDGSDEREFLDPYFSTGSALLTAIFLKGYEWPFDPRKCAGGSSLIDILVYHETQTGGRRVFLDYTRNPSCASLAGGSLDFALLEETPRAYLENSGCLLPRPIDRLSQMNAPAIELYRSNGYDITREPLEIGVCAQHNNGGLAVDAYWESNIRHLFPVGEIAGTFGVYRPGGSALNATQTGGRRAAERIAVDYRENAAPPAWRDADAASLAALCCTLVAPDGLDRDGLLALTRGAQANMSKNGAHIRTTQGVRDGISACEAMLVRWHGGGLIADRTLLPQAFELRNMLLTQLCYLRAIEHYVAQGGGSRGSYLVGAPLGRTPGSRLPHPALPERFAFALDTRPMDSVCVTALRAEDGGWVVTSRDEPVRPIPQSDQWFETVWADYRSRHSGK